MMLPDFLYCDDGGCILLKGHRIGLVDVVIYYRNGDTAEMLWERFPTLPLALIHHVLAFYLDHLSEVDAYVDREIEACEKLRAASVWSGPPIEEMRRRWDARQMTTPHTTSAA